MQVTCGSRRHAAGWTVPQWPSSPHRCTLQRRRSLRRRKRRRSRSFASMRWPSSCNACRIHGIAILLRASKWPWKWIKVPHLVGISRYTIHDPIFLDYYLLLYFEGPCFAHFFFWRKIKSIWIILNSIVSQLSFLDVFCVKTGSTPKDAFLRFLLK